MRNFSLKSSPKVPAKTYRVTCSVLVRATSARHAAHVGKGVMQMKDEEGPATFTVEEHTVRAYKVDLSKREGQPGYQDVDPNA